MAGITGTNLYLLFDGTVLDTDYRAFSNSEEMGLVDQSAGSDTGSTFLTTLRTGTASATIVIQSEDTATWGLLIPGSEGTLEWGEEGTTAGKPRHYVNAIVASRTKTAEYTDLITADIAFQYSAQTAVTDTTY